MGIEALTHNLAGNLVVPATDAEWEEWVSASRVRNPLLDNPLLDWLDRYGEEHGYVRDEGAMVGAWWCDREAERSGGSMRDLEVMQGIERYNEVDCKAMMELVRYLRRNH